MEKEVLQHISWMSSKVSLPPLMLLYRKQISGSLLQVLVQGHGSGSQLWAVWWSVEFRQKKTTSPLPVRLKVQGYVCLRKVGEWESSYLLFWGSGDAARGYSGQQATPERRALWGGWESITSKCPPSWSFHCSTSLSCFVVHNRTWPDLGHITLTSYHSQQLSPI